MRAFSESFTALARSGEESVTAFLLEEREVIFNVLCRAGESQDIVVRNLAQLLFSHLLSTVLHLRVPYREQIEVLYVKLILKPLEQLEIRMNASQPQVPATAASPSPNKDKMQMGGLADSGEVSFLSDTEDNQAPDDPALATLDQPQANVYEHPLQFKFEQEVCLNALVDTLLSLQPDHLAQFFLVYDC